MYDGASLSFYRLVGCISGLSTAIEQMLSDIIPLLLGDFWQSFLTSGYHLVCPDPQYCDVQPSGLTVELLAGIVFLLVILLIHGQVSFYKMNLRSYELWPTLFF